jgi:hypothetical protein
MSGATGSPPARVKWKNYPRNAPRWFVPWKLSTTSTQPWNYGRAALWKFRLYWSLVGPFSGLIRKAILKHVKTEAESTVTQAL